MNKYEFSGGVVRKAYTNDEDETLTFHTVFPEAGAVEKQFNTGLGELIESGNVEVTLVLEEVDE